jgi:hypothetical protein
MKTDIQDIENMIEKSLTKAAQHDLFELNNTDEFFIKAIQSIILDKYYAYDILEVNFDTHEVFFNIHPSRSIYTIEVTA